MVGERVRREVPTRRSLQETKARCLLYGSERGPNVAPINSGFDGGFYYAGDLGMRFCWCWI